MTDGNSADDVCVKQVTVFSHKFIWITSDFQERLDDNRERMVTLERQMAPRKD